MFSSPVSEIDSSAPRPPTPPRELSDAIDDAIAYLDDSNEVDRLLSNAAKHRRIAEESSRHSPAPSRGLTGANSASKKVDFSIHSTDRHIETPGLDPSPGAHQTRRSPSSKSARPARSILKLSNPAFPPTPDNIEAKLGYFSPHVPGSFANMLQSIVQQLAGPSRQLRLDAYLAINGVLKAYEDVPDVEAMAQKMGLFAQFLTRDMAWKNADGNLDINIVTQSLKLASTVLAIPRLAEALDDDFKAFLIDRSITAFEQADMPKAIVKSHMHLVAQHRFHTKLLSAARADKLLTVLNTIESRCSGNGTVAARLVIYMRLFEYSPAVMLAKMKEWIEHVFHGMLSSVKEVRTRAIETCTQAGLRFGQNSHAAKVLFEMLAAEIEDGETYYDFLSVRLVAMLAEKDLSAFVPQIWSTVILFFRSKRTPLARWPRLKAWLLIIQKCLNCSDASTRYQATLAWNKLVFTAMPDSSTDDKMMSMLSVPISTAVERRVSDKHSQQARQHALDGYYNLLYYALRPGLTKEEHDKAWDLYVAPILRELAKSSGKGRFVACRVLHGLMNGNTGIWNPNAALEQVQIKPEELPRLDPRWIRSRSGKILSIMEPIIAASMWLSKEANAALEATWYCLMQSIAEAGSQEVKTSSELKETIALIITIFRRLWHGCTEAPSNASESLWLKRYVSLIETTVNGLGLGPFTEDILTATRENKIEVAATPSHRHLSTHGPSQSPFLVLLAQFECPPRALKNDEEFAIAIRTLLRCMISARSSTVAKLSVLDNYLQALSHRTTLGCNDHVKAQVWTSFAVTAILVLNIQPPSLGVQEPQSMGITLRHALNVLSTGLELATDDAVCKTVEDFYGSILGAARKAALDGGIVLAAMEPFAQALINAGASVPIGIKSRLVWNMLDQAVWPKSRQTLEQARKSLWGIDLTPQKPSLFDPFEHVYAIINDLLKKSYDSFSTDKDPGLDVVESFVSSMLGFLDQSPLSHLATTIRKLQQGLSTWILDESRKTGNTGEASKLVSELWTSIIRLMLKLPHKDSALLRAIDTLLAAGFSSPHKTIVNASILFWNDTFGSEETLEYPETLEKILRARSRDAEISLPGFPDHGQDGEYTSLPAFFATEPQLFPGVDLPREHNDAQKFLGRPMSSHSVQQSTLSTNAMSPARRFKNPSGQAFVVTRKLAGSTPKPRLRHDDSQIQFAPIDSSPLPPVDDSQLLTEHQREVKNRQHENAQLFSDFSSSPAAQSTALPRNVSKRLDFNSNTHQRIQGGDHGTPTALLDGAASTTSDDLPSSPTPSSARDTNKQSMEEEDNQLVDDAMDEPPSSPPQARRELNFDQHGVGTVELEAGQHDRTVAVTEMAAVGHAELPENVSFPRNLRKDHEQTVAEEADDLTSSFPSDSILPTKQLQTEEEAASGHMNQDTSEDEVNEPGQGIVGGEDPSNQHHSSKQDTLDVEVDQDVTRVKNSFIKPTDTGNEDYSQPNGSSQQGQYSDKKRKRARPSLSSSTKRQRQSPLKRFAAYLLGQSQEQDDDDMGDEIVVASSQRSSSPVKCAADETIGVPSQPNEGIPGTAEHVKGVVLIEGSQRPSVQAIKRGRGRPRKMPKPDIHQLGALPTNTLKRKASALDRTTAAEEHAASSVVEATPEPSGSGAVHGAARDEGNLHDSQRKRRRRSARHGANAVLAGSEDVPDVDGRGEHTRESDSAQAPGEGGVDSAEAAAHAAQDRAIPSPRSLLQRLQDVLADFGGAILGSQEEREYDDVLFTFRREVHEAGRRGREQRT